MLADISWNTQTLAVAGASAHDHVLDDGVAPHASVCVLAGTAVLPTTDAPAPVDETLVCLARSIYWEAKGQEVADMEAVASVVLNRLAVDDFPDTVCGVVTDGQEGGSCQFGWWCDGKSDKVTEPAQYEIAIDVARRALNGELADRTDGALYFLGTGSRPGWTRDMVATAEIGGHVFFRPSSTE